MKSAVKPLTLILFVFLVASLNVWSFAGNLISSGDGQGTKEKHIEKTGELKVLAWNIWGALNLEDRYVKEGKTARERTIEIIKDSDADIIAMVETYGSAADIAQALGYYYYTPSEKANLTLFSRFKLHDVGTPEGLSSFSFIRATAEIGKGRKVKVHAIWLTSSGRHIVAVKDKSISDADFIEADEPRARQLLEFLAHPEIQQDLKNKDRIPVIVAGDFNCVSHLDYTPESASLGLNHHRNFASHPVSSSMLEHGFVDSYRSIHPEITDKTLGYTWTTVGKGFKYVSDMGFVEDPDNTDALYRGLYSRIDFIYHTGRKLRPLDSEVIRFYKNHTSRSFPEFPSDHAAVLSTFRIR